MKFSIKEWIFHIQVQDKELNFIEMFNNNGLIIEAKLTWNLPLRLNLTSLEMSCFKHIIQLASSVIPLWLCHQYSVPVFSFELRIFWQWTRVVRFKYLKVPSYGRGKVFFSWAVKQGEGDLLPIFASFQFIPQAQFVQFGRDFGGVLGGGGAICDSIFIVTNLMCYGWVMAQKLVEIRAENFGKPCKNSRLPADFRQF